MRTPWNVPPDCVNFNCTTMMHQFAMGPTFTLVCLHPAGLVQHATSDSGWRADCEWPLLLGWGSRWKWSQPQGFGRWWHTLQGEGKHSFLRVLCSHACNSSLNLVFQCFFCLCLSVCKYLSIYPAIFLFLPLYIEECLPVCVLIFYPCMLLSLSPHPSCLLYNIRIQALFLCSVQNFPFSLTVFVLFLYILSWSVFILINELTYVF